MYLLSGPHKLLLTVQIYPACWHVQRINPAFLAEAWELSLLLFYRNSDALELLKLLLGYQTNWLQTNLWKILCFVFSVFGVNAAALETENGAADLQDNPR